MGSLIKWGSRHLFLTATFTATTVLALILLAGIVFAHDHEHNTDWIGDDHLTNGLGQLCCGENDCQEIPSEWVKNLPDGVHIHVKAHFKVHDYPAMGIEGIPEGDHEWDEIWAYKDVTPNPKNGKTYRCAWPTPKDRKCLVHGQPGS